MDPRSLASTPLTGHIGLASCAERVEGVGGSLSIEGKPGVGLAVSVRIPAQEAAQEGSLESRANALEARITT